MTFNQTSNFLSNGRDLNDFATRIAKPSNLGELLQQQVQQIRKSQVVLYADGSQALLLVFQGMDCAGKDSTIKHVLSGVNPQGIHVASFKAPTANEIAHSYMWRYWREMPRRGMIGVFNRSHYEEALVMRVHPEFFAGRRMPMPQLDDAFWQARLEDLMNFENHLYDNGVHVVKFFLNLSKDEQRKRLLARIDRPHKNWKFNPRDLDERALWDQYRTAYAAAIEATHTETAPWYVIPADHKPTMRALIAQIVAEKLASMPIKIPMMSPEIAAQLQQSKLQLEAE